MHAGTYDLVPCLSPFRLKVLHLYGCAHLPTEHEIKEVNSTVNVSPLSWPWQLYLHEIFIEQIKEGNVDLAKYVALLVLFFYAITWATG